MNKEIFRKIQGYLLNRLGFQKSFLRPLECKMLAGLSQEESLYWIKWLHDKCNFQPKVIVDVGASDGRWTKPAMKLFPVSQFILVEPLPQHREALKELCQNKNVQYYEGLAANRAGRMTLNVHGHQSSIFGNAQGGAFGTQISVEAMPLDNILSKMRAMQPDIIKLDVQGAELMVLDGARMALKATQAVQLEIALFPFQKDIPLLDDIVRFMSDQCFRVFNIFGIYGRPIDGMPVQGECLFIKKESALIDYFRWAEKTEWS